MKKSNMTLATILIAGICICLSGCSGKKDAAGKVELRLVTLYRDAGYQAMYRRFIAEFEKRRPGIKIKYEPVSGDYYMKFQTQIAGNAAPDIIDLAGKTLAEYGSRGALVDLRSFIKKDNFSLDDFYKLSLAEAAVPSGAVFGLPQVGGPEVLFYSKDLFDKAHLSYPDESWTWQDALKAARKLTVDLDGDGRVDQFGISCPLQGWMATLPFIWENGGDLLDPGKTRCVLHSPETGEAIQFLLDLRHKYKVAPTATSDATYGEWDALFASGRIGMVICHPEELLSRYAKAKNLRWDLCPRPKGRKGRVPRYTGSVLSIWSGSRHKEEAWELVKFLTSKEVLKEFARNNWMPARRSVAESPDFVKDATPFHEEVFVKSMRSARVLPNLPKLGNSGELSTVWDQQMDQLELGNVTVDKALKNIEDRINGILANEK